MKTMLIMSIACATAMLIWTCYTSIRTIDRLIILERSMASYDRLYQECYLETWKLIKRDRSKQ